MEIALSKQDAQEALSRLLSFAKKDDPFAAVYVTDEIILSAYSDTELIEIKCEGNIVEDGLALLPLAELSKLAAKTTSEEIKIKAGAKSILISAKRLKAEIPTKDINLAHKRYSPPTNLVEISDVVILRGLISRVKKGLNKQEENQTYNNIKLTLGNSGIKAASVNNHLLAIANYTGKISNMEIIIPGRAVDNFYKVLSFIDGPVSLGLDSNCLYLESEKIKYKTALAPVTIPAIDKIMAATYENSIVVDGAEFGNALDLVSIGIDPKDQYVDLRFNGTSIEFSGNSVCKVNPEVSLVGSPVNNELIRFKFDWLQDVIGKSNIAIEFGSANMVKFTHVGDPYEAQYILVKARI